MTCEVCVSRSATGAPPAACLAVNPCSIAALHACYCVNAVVVVRRMRKDPLDPIDNGTKVALAFRRVTNPKAVADEEKRRKEEQAAAKQAGAPAKAGAWSGLPGR